MKSLLNKSLNNITTISLILLILFGFYKNGIFLYTKNYVTFLEMFKPLLLIFMSISGSVLGSFIHEHKKQKGIKLEYIDVLKTDIIESTILACVLPISTSPIILFIVVLIMYLIKDKYKFNYLALLFVIISLINRLLGTNVYENVYELSTVLNYNRIDLFFGLGSGGIASTSIVLIIGALIALSFNKLYKKEVAISSILTFIVITLLLSVIGNNYSGIFKTLFSHNILFALVFVAPITLYSCYTTKGQVLSGIIIGISTIVLSYYIPYESVFVSIFLVSLIKNIIDRIFVIM